jgi:hypothetical protein
MDRDGSPRVEGTAKPAVLLRNFGTVRNERRARSASYRLRREPVTTDKLNIYHALRSTSPQGDEEAELARTYETSCQRATASTRQRHNFRDAAGVIYLTRRLFRGGNSVVRCRRSRISAVSASRSSRRNGARPADTLTKGSSTAILVHPTGNDRVARQRAHT